MGATTRAGGPARVAQAHGLENVAQFPSGRVAPHPMISWSFDEHGDVQLAINNPHRGNFAKPVDLTPDEEALVRALNTVSKIEDKKVAGAAYGPLWSLLTNSLTGRNEY